MESTQGNRKRGQDKKTHCTGGGSQAYVASSEQERGKQHSGTTQKKLDMDSSIRKRRVSFAKIVGGCVQQNHKGSEQLDDDREQN